MTEKRDTASDEPNSGNREWLAQQFEASRPHLRAVAYRMLGSASEAEDAVQESWLRLSRTGAGEINNLGGWLTTVVSRVCLDMLRSRSSRHEESLDVMETPDAVAPREEGGDPEGEAVMAESVGSALLVVLNTLEPAERLAFVLHDLFGVPFEEIAPIVGRAPAAARQLASRARRRVRGAAPEGEDGEVGESGAESQASSAQQREIVSAFLAASRGGDFAALLELLDPNAIYRADASAVATGSLSAAHGAREVAAQFSGRARTAQLALVGGVAGLTWAPGGQPRVAFRFTFSGDKITAIEVVADPDDLAGLNVTLLDQ